MAVQLSEAFKKVAIQNYIVGAKAIPLAFEVQLYWPDPDYLKARAQNWYKRYGFNSEQEFESFWSKYGNKVKLKWLQASAADFPSYEEYVRQAELASVKLTLAHGTGEVWPQRNADIAYKPILRVTTADGRTWDFDVARYEAQAATRLPPRRVFYNILRLASSPLVTSIETISTSNPKAFGGGQFELFTEWIISNRIPLTLDKIPNISGFDHPPLWPPPYSGTLTGGTTTGGTATGSTTTGSTTTGGTTTTEGTTTTAVVKSALPYVAIGAGVLLLLWAMKK